MIKLKKTLFTEIQKVGIGNIVITPKEDKFKKNKNANHSQKQTNVADDSKIYDFSISPSRSIFSVFKNENEPWNLRIEADFLPPALPKEEGHSWRNFSQNNRLAAIEWDKFCEGKTFIGLELCTIIPRNRVLEMVHLSEGTLRPRCQLFPVCSLRRLCFSFAAMGQKCGAKRSFSATVTFEVKCSFARSSQNFVEIGSQKFPAYEKDATVFFFLDME